MELNGDTSNMILVQPGDTARFYMETFNWDDAAGLVKLRVFKRPGTNPLYTEVVVEDVELFYVNNQPFPVYVDAIITADLDGAATYTLGISTNVRNNLAFDSNSIVGDGGKVVASFTSTGMQATGAITSASLAATGAVTSESLAATGAVTAGSLVVTGTSRITVSSATDEDTVAPGSFTILTGGTGSGDSVDMGVASVAGLITTVVNHTVNTYIVNGNASNDFHVAGVSQANFTLLTGETASFISFVDGDDGESPPADTYGYAIMQFKSAHTLYEP